MHAARFRIGKPLQGRTNKNSGSLLFSYRLGEVQRPHPGREHLVERLRPLQEPSERFRPLVSGLEGERVELGDAASMSVRQFLPIEFGSNLAINLRTLLYELGKSEFRLFMIDVQLAPHLFRPPVNSQRDVKTCLNRPGIAGDSIC